MTARALQTAAIIVLALALLTWITPTQSESPATASQTPAASAASASVTVAPLIPATSATAAPPAPGLEDLRISVPALGIDLPLAPGDVARDVPVGRYAGDTPERFAFVFPGSAAFAAGGNTYIYAHARVGMFLSLWNAHPGDLVVVYAPGTPSWRLTYIVVRIVPRVDPSDTSWLDPAGPERLTLQTSTGPNAGDPRFIVVAARDAASPAGSASP